MVELVGGADFYASPKLSPDGSALAWVSWEHPNMPWDNTCLSVGEVSEDGSIGPTRVVCGDKEPQAVSSPRWSPANNKLHFITDTSGWWNICVEESPGGEVTPLCPMEGAEFGGPAWGLGSSPYSFLPDGRLLCQFSGPGVDAGGDQVLTNCNI